MLKEGFDEELLVDDFALPQPLEHMPDDFREQRVAAFERYEHHVNRFSSECGEEGSKVRNSAAYTSLPPNGTTAAVSITSCVDVLVAKETPGKVAFISVSMMN